MDISIQILTYEHSQSYYASICQYIEKQYLQKKSFCEETKIVTLISRNFEVNHYLAVVL